MEMALTWSSLLMTLVTCAYAGLFGGREGRWISGMLLGATLVTMEGVRYLTPSILDEPRLVFLIDVALLGGLMVIALKTDRYWPLWIAGLHSLSVLSYFAWALDEQMLVRLFRVIETVWSIPIQTILAVGVRLDRKAQQRLAPASSDGRRQSGEGRSRTRSGVT